MRRDYHRWYSPHLNRDMELLVFGHGGERMLVFPTRCGRFFDYENWGLVDCWRQRIEAGEVQLWCVDSVDAESVYCAWAKPEQRIHRHLAYERYFFDEVIPFSKVDNSDQRLSAHGCSLGAWHAMNVACRHPERFTRILAFSGRFDLTRTIAHYRDLFDGHYDQDIYFNMPSHYVPGLTAEYLLNPLRNLAITMTSGELDPLVDNNRDYSASLHRQGVYHRLHVWRDDAHRPKWWRKMIQEYA